MSTSPETPDRPPDTPWVVIAIVCVLIVSATMIVAAVLP